MRTAIFILGALPFWAIAQDPVVPPVISTAISDSSVESVINTPIEVPPQPSNDPSPTTDGVPDAPQTTSELSELSVDLRTTFELPLDIDTTASVPLGQETAIQPPPPLSKPVLVLFLLRHRVLCLIPRHNWLTRLLSQRPRPGTEPATTTAPKDSTVIVLSISSQVNSLTPKIDQWKQDPEAVKDETNKDVQDAHDDVIAAIVLLEGSPAIPCVPGPIGIVNQLTCAASGLTEASSAIIAGNVTAVSSAISDIENNFENSTMMS
ncbi:hypothetical protein HG530_003898 [Fusarium avenaceum]|nr:hypothetical protein DER45DRAFT_535719 [Fusarium avenaceum]KAI6772940.1 hypothetical protein HG530_003898 [Fusarium avenaceum]